MLIRRDRAIKTGGLSLVEDADTRSPVSFETAAQHASTNVPVITPTQREREALDALTGLAVGVALFGACSTASVAAMTLPWLFDAAGADPAFGSGPLATVIQDLLSILTYSAVATSVMR